MGIALGRFLTNSEHAAEDHTLPTTGVTGAVPSVDSDAGTTTANTVTYQGLDEAVQDAPATHITWAAGSNTHASTTADVAGNFALYAGNNAGSGAGGSLDFDAGTSGSGTAGTISLGVSNASALTLGRAAVGVSVPGWLIAPLVDTSAGTTATQLSMGAGAVATPAITFGDADSGIYSTGGGSIINIGVGTGQRFNVSGSAVSTYVDLNINSDADVLLKGDASQLGLGATTDTFLNRVSAGVFGVGATTDAADGALTAATITATTAVTTAAINSPDATSSLTINNGLIIARDSINGNDGNALLNWDALQLGASANDVWLDDGGGDGTLLVGKTQGAIDGLVSADTFLAGTGLASAAAADLSVTSGTTGTLTIDSGTTGTIGIGVGSFSKSLTIGNPIGTTIIVMSAGTLGVDIAGFLSTAVMPVNLGTGGTGAKTVTVGSVASSSSMTLQSGSGAMTFTAGGIFDVNAAGAVTVDGASIALTTTSTGALTLDSGTTGAIDVGTNANAKTITLGNVTGATGLIYNAGSGGHAFTGNMGFFGTSPVAKAAAYTPTNVSTDRAYDANATTLDELADVVGTLIADLQAYGLVA